MPDGPVTPYKVEIKPIELLQRGKELVGDQYLLFLGITALGVLISGLVPPAILMGPMFCGIYLCYRKLSNREEVAFEDLFKGFDHFAQGLIATLIIIGSTLIVAIPFFIAVVAGAAMVDSRDDALEALGVMTLIGTGGLWLVFVTLITMLTLFPFALIVDKGLSGVEAVRMSARGVWMNLGGVFKLWLLTSVLSLVATLLCCGIGGVLVLPYVMAANWLAHREIFSDAEVEENEPTVFVDDEEDDEPVDEDAPSA